MNVAAAREASARPKPAPTATPLYERFAELIELEQVNRYLAEMPSAVDVRYDLGEGGGFVPDLTLEGGVGVRDLFAAGRTLLLDLSDDPAVRKTAADWADRLDVVTASMGAAPLLVRPDGHVAWAGNGNLREVLERWLGRPV